MKKSVSVEISLQHSSGATSKSVGATGSNVTI